MDTPKRNLIERSLRNGTRTFLLTSPKYPRIFRLSPGVCMLPAKYGANRWLVLTPTDMICHASPYALARWSEIDRAHLVALVFLSVCGILSRSLSFALTPMNRSRRLLIRWEKKVDNYLAMVQKFPRFLSKLIEMGYNRRVSPWDFSFLLLFSF